MNKDISKWLIFDGCVTLQFEIDHDDGDLLFVLSKLIQWLMLQFGCGDWTKKTKKQLQDGNFNLSVADDELYPTIIHFLT